MAPPTGTASLDPFGSVAFAQQPQPQTTQSNDRAALKAMLSTVEQTSPTASLREQLQGPQQPAYRPAFGYQQPGFGMRQLPRAHSSDPFAGTGFHY